jgi:hypothetical protein
MQQQRWAHPQHHSHHRTESRSCLLCLPSAWPQATGCSGTGAPDPGSVQRAAGSTTWNASFETKHRAARSSALAFEKQGGFVVAGMRQTRAGRNECTRACAHRCRARSPLTETGLFPSVQPLLPRSTLRVLGAFGRSSRQRAPTDLAGPQNRSRSAPRTHRIRKSSTERQEVCPDVISSAIRTFIASPITCLQPALHDAVHSLTIFYPCSPRTARLT